MVRGFFRDSAIFVIPAAVASGMSFFMFPFYAHHFTSSQYGVLDLLMLTGMLVSWTVALEIYQAVALFVAGEQDRARARSYASTALWFTAGAYAGFAVVVELLATPLSHLLLGVSVSVSLLRVAVPLMCAQGVLLMVMAQLRWQLRPVASAIGSIISAVFTVVASAVLVFGAHLEVAGAILGQLIGSVAALTYGLIATRGTFNMHFDLKKCKEMLAFSLPLVLSSVGVFLNLYADRLVIQHLRSLSDVGVYGVGYRLAMIVSLMLLGFQGAATPLILARKENPSTPADLARILRIFIALALSAFVVLTILATPALRILAAARYQKASSVVPFLICSVLFAGMYIFAPGITIARKTVLMAKLTVLAGLGNLALAVLLVPPLGIIGAGIATASTSLAWFIALMAASQRYYPAPHDWRQLTVALATVAAFVAISLTILPADRNHALSPSILAARAFLVVTGIALSMRLALGRHMLSLALQAVPDTIAKLRVRHRRRVSVME